MQIPPMRQTKVTSMTDETWLPVPGYEGRYEASTEGRVRSLFRKSRLRAEPLILAQVLNSQTGYLQVALCLRGKISMKRVHTVILETFVGPKLGKLDACHFDGNRVNNRAANLRWDTRSANHLDKKRHGTFNPPPITRKKSMEVTAMG